MVVGYSCCLVWQLALNRYWPLHSIGLRLARQTCGAPYGHLVMVVMVLKSRLVKTLYVQELSSFGRPLILKELSKSRRESACGQAHLKAGAFQLVDKLT